MISPTALLKESTRAVHSATEADFDLRRLFGSREAYSRLLRALLETTIPLERGIDLTLGEPVRDVHPREQMSDWLRRDLKALEGPDPAIPPPESRPLGLDSKPAALGALYVLEGSLLGGQIIARRLETELGIGPESGGRYYHGRGKETLPHWRSVKSYLDSSLQEPADFQEALSAALSTFELFGNAFRTALHD